MKTTIQHDQRDCAAACLHMVANHYGFTQSITYYRELTKTDQKGASIYGIIDASKKIGLNGQTMSGSIDELLEEIESKNVVFPFIAHVLTDNNLLHFVVVSKYRNGKFTINDPGKGKYTVSKDDFSAFWTGYIVTFEKTDSFVKKSGSVPGLGRFFKLLITQNRRIALAVFLSIVISVIGITGAFVFRIVIDSCPDTSAVHTESLTEEHDHDHDHCLEEDINCESESEGIIDSLQEINQHGLIIIFTSLIAMYLLCSVIQYIRGKLIITVSKNIDLKLVLPYFYRIIDMPIHSVELRQTGDYLSRFSDATTIRDAISTATLTLFLDALMAIGCGVILFIQNRILFLISLAVIAIYALVVFLYKGRLSMANRNFMEANAMVQSYIKESIDGISTVKATISEVSVKNSFSNKFTKLVNAIVSRSRIGTSLDAVVTAIQSIGVAVILWCGFSFVLNGSLSIGTLVSFYALLSYFIEPVKNLIGLLPSMQSASVAAQRLSDILDSSIENDTSDGQRLEKNINWKVEKVNFRYGNNDLTLKDVSLSVKSGEKVAIIGESGCGKTTLAKLFLRFYNPESGSIYANNISIDKYSLSDLRSKVAYVDQNTFFFSGTIRENLMLGHSEIDEEDVINACKAAGIYDFIKKQPFGLDTIIEENGVNLSGGQKQRLAIARALIKKPQFLILDEATSNLDTVTEAYIKNTISDLGPNTACLIIAHRLSTIKNCDRIYVMKEGYIFESGTHGELIKKRGIYYNMLMQQ